MNEFTAEFIGTMFLILMGNGVVANVVLKGTKGNDSGWIVITTGWALAVFTGVVIAAPYSGAHINPAVTLGLAIAGEFPWEKAPIFIGAQMLGAMAGSFLVWAIYRQHFNCTTNSNLHLAAFSTAPAIRNKFSNLLSEIIGTFTLIFVIFYVTNPVMGNESETPIGMGSLGAIPVAFLVWAIGLSLGGTTGYAINPARDLGPRIVHSLVPIKNKCKSDWNYSWIPIIGPVIGASIAAIAYLFLNN
ncbi:MIP/aquaporin family protein [Salegentibacter maritimus]|uniref:MIP/aquaporin family protein n=1 Tax=Salegentibacter maritimus TaxID=2794347 RepID=UPI0018E40DBF|nr:MIP/aquaporin family protein [Salegentibacter maritimus]MBI6118145.1 aquaporin family protein [Salegentibacter maritimus]